MASLEYQKINLKKMYQQLTSNRFQVFNPTMHASKKWLSRLDEIVKTNDANPAMSNLQIAQKLGISERDLFRKVKNSTGLSPQKYLRQHRLKQAMQWLMEGKYRTVNATSKAIGYSNVSYFITQFEKEFGKKPLQILKEQGWR